MDETEYSTIKQLRMILNSYDGSNYKSVLKGIYLRSKTSMELINNG
jgi:hypothetical protein